MDLKSRVSELPFVGPAYVTRLAKLDIKTIEDLLYHIPARFLDFRKSSPISALTAGETVNIEGVISDFRNQYTKGGRKLQLAVVEDSTGKIEIVWFNQPYLSRVLKQGDKLSISGKVDWFGRRLAFISPEYEVLGKNGAVHTKGLVAIYPETAGISSKWLRRRISDAIKNIEIEEFLSPEVLAKYNLVNFKDSVVHVHNPKELEEYEIGKKRLAFNELIFQHLKNLYRKGEWEKIKVNHKLDIDRSKLGKFIKSLPFALTKSQSTVVDEILDDLDGDIPMNRLLEGDVGSGKTVVAAIASLGVHNAGFKTVFMAPTQILAQQHFITLNKLFEDLGLKISLVTANEKSISKDTNIYIGTHALIHRKINLKNVALIIIDEQHRFGVEQRQHLIDKTGKKNVAPHVLTMTATPIPRTMALTLYGDLSLSVINELPIGRKPITTWITPPTKREDAYRWIDKQIENEKIQAYVICPLIEESEKLTEVKAVTKQAEELKKLLPHRKIELLHGRQSAKMKNEILDKFKDKEIDILVATPVIEVGIDVPNATIMTIEAGERFGLAQLHQLRGRVGRGEKKSYCIVLAETKSPQSINRLEALKQSKSGFELAELDFKLRGPGEISGLKQSGVPYLKVANWGDVELIKDSREVAEEIIKNPGKFKLELDSKPW